MSKNYEKWSKMDESMKFFWGAFETKVTKIIILFLLSFLINGGIFVRIALTAFLFYGLTMKASYKEYVDELKDKKF